MSLLVIRPDEWNLPLLLHVAGAMVLTGAVVVAAAALVLSVRSDNDDRYPLVHFAFRTLRFAGIPSVIVLRGAAAWIESKEGLENTDSAWLGIGYATAEGGALLIIIATILAWLASRRIRTNPDGPSMMTRISMALTFVLIAAYVVAVWAMTTKPS
jgi:hypothetical protein